ncbi:ABC transporter permease [Planktomarina temperata]|jgi:rhamnose transport system permease protein|uniref:Autoinducer 2 import system permease protein LsrD n=1 Tax=Planktomarina temperata RCA23 TaxID=666509 RepID=A0AAN0RKG2_9RHOB|nr:putative ribose ABC transport system, permease protein RbsC [Planktomarina temperata RCA23]HBS37396.1 ABC transporter permease [Paracoccaceae bacterium]|tara:strand:+ start:410 stop:1405 length:996 start_codon:yes stop_codon:yes gene_type:complete
MSTENFTSRIVKALNSWEGFLLLVLVLLFVGNTINSPFFFTLNNQINLFQLSIEKVIVAVIMTFVIINAEIDLSVASIMGFAACLFGWLFQSGVSASGAVVIVLAAGAILGAFNAFWIAWVGIPSLVVTLATMIAFRGFARVLVEDRGITGFPDWFDKLGQAPLVGPIPLSILVFFVLVFFFYIVLQRTVFGRQVYFIGSNRDVAEYSGINVRGVQAIIFTLSGLISALAGLLFAARLGAVRGDAALGFELDIITIVLLGGVSIFGGRGTMVGTLLAILIVLNLRNGMALANITGHIQTGVLGILLILSVMVPNIQEWIKKLRKLGKGTVE